MTLDQIKEVQEAFARTAERAREAGFDGVEIIGSAGYLVTQFLSPKTNKRTDQYGGSFENRVRFPRELIELMRKRLGPDFPITIRMAGNDFVPGSNTDTETPQFARVYEQAGIDAINVTGGWHESKVPQLPMHLPRSGFSYLALNIKRAVSVPVMASNRICTPEEAERILREGCADMVNLGRVLLADPDWPNKAEKGRAKEIRPCVACSQGCTDMAFKGKPVFCVSNPFTGFETERSIPRADTPKKVLVVGAGLAGMEAAVTAAQMGHQVEVFDRAGWIGGQINLAGVPPHKGELLEFIRYYGAMSEKHNLPVQLNTAVDLNLIKSRNPDHVILAAGARPLVPDIPGADGPKVLSAWQVLAEKPLVGPRVAIIGGGAVGLETALFLAQRGALTPEALHFLFMYQAESVERLHELMVRGSTRVTVFEVLPKVGRDVGPSTKWVLLDQLKRFGVQVVTKAQVKSIADGRVEYVREEEPLAEEFDHVVLAVGVKPDNALAADLEKAGIPYTLVGDCVRPGRIEEAIHGGFKAAVEI